MENGANRASPRAGCSRWSVQLIVDREEEIRDFKQEEYWTIDAKLSTSRSKKQFPARLASFKGEKVEIKNEAQAEQILSELEGGDFVITDIKKGVQRKRPRLRPSSPRPCSRRLPAA